MKKLLKTMACALVTIIALCTVACAPFTLGDTCSKLLEKGYEIESYYIKNDADANMEYFGFELESGAYLIEAYKETAFSEREIYIFVFDKISDLNNIYQEYRSDLKEMLDDEGVIKKHGKMLVIATESAYEDFIS